MVEKKFNAGTIFIRDPSTAYQQIQIEIYKTILIAAIIFLFVIIISYHSAGKVTQNLRSLAELTKEIAKGNFSKKSKS